MCDISITGRWERLWQTSTNAQPQKSTGNMEKKPMMEDG
jgi:uncharacterized membrane protein